MSNDLIYLVDIQDAINQIEKYASQGKDAFFRERILQDAIVRNFMTIGEAVKRLQAETTSVYPRIPWKDIAGFRDILIHNYSGIDYTYVWNVIETHLPPLKETIEKLISEAE